ncbi:MAG: hypothetical protein RIG77_01880 [Cyclobacteriaceae bacterium]
MAHFITLFFLSIGLNFGSVSQVENPKFNSFQKSNLIKVSKIEAKKPSKYNSKLFTDNNNNIWNNQLIGHEGWD